MELLKFIGYFFLGAIFANVLTLSLIEARKDTFDLQMDKTEKDRTTITIGWKEGSSEQNNWYAGSSEHKHFFILDNKEDYQVASELIVEDASGIVNKLVVEYHRKLRLAKEELKKQKEGK